MKIISKTALAFAVPSMILSWGSASAANLEPISAVGKRAVVPVETTAGYRTMRGVKRVDAVEDFGRVLYLDGQAHGHRSRASTLVVDCGSRRVGVDAWRLHEGPRGEGRVVFRWASQGPASMIQPVPGSSHAHVLERTCGVAAVALVD